jgi:hypothetical protein
MSRRCDLSRLENLSALMLDQRLARLRAAADLCDQSRMQIAALDQAAAPAGLPPVAAGQVALRYQLWADRRRGELNTVLARQTADWLEARAEAQRAFGKLQALRGLGLRQQGKN